MNRLAVFRLYFKIRRHNHGVIGATRIALREAFTKLPF